MSGRILTLACLALLTLARPAAAYEILHAPAAPEPNLYYGGSVCEVGDVDGNGLGDFVVGATYFTNSAPTGGRVYLYLPATDGTMPPPVGFDPAGYPSLFGKELGAAGDVNGDGFADFVVTSENMHAVHLFLGAATPAAIVRVVIPSPGSKRCTRSEGTGDIDGDGYDDVMVAAFWDNLVWVYRGGPAFDTTPDFTLQGTGNFGLEMAPLGDVNDDGYDDFAVSAPYFVVGAQQLGSVSFYLGGPSFDTTADFVLYGQTHQEGFGRPLRPAGDFNGDGRPDLLVCAPNYDDPTGRLGRLDIFYLDPLVGAVRGTSIYGTAQDLLWHIDGDADLDLDGVPDIATSAMPPSPIRMCVFSGAALRGQAAVSTAWANRVEALRVGDMTSVADLNGDGLREFLVGIPTDQTGGRGGRALVLAGGHHQVLHLRTADVTAAPGEPVTVTVMAGVRSTNPLAIMRLSALDLELRHDLDEIAFQGVEMSEVDAPWSIAGAGGANWTNVSAVSLASPTFDTVERPFLKLHFLAGATEAATVLQLQALEAHASTTLPQLVEWESGTVTVRAPDMSGTPSPTATATFVRAYPNPCNPQARLEWNSPRAGAVAVAIFDARGRRIWHRDFADLSAGEQETAWPGVGDDGRPVASGTYLLEARGDLWRARSRLTVVR